MLTLQIPLAGLTVACIGGAYNGIGIRRERLSELETMKGMQVRLMLQQY